MPDYKDDGRQGRGRGAGELIGLIMAVAALVGCNHQVPHVEQETIQTSPTPDKSSTQKNVKSGLPDYLTPEALSKSVDDHEALVRAFSLTGSTPEELAENTQYVEVAVLMSGTTMADLNVYRQGTSGGGENDRRYTNEGGLPYEAGACEGMFGTRCSIDQNTHNGHEVILSIYCINHGNPDGSTALGPDFSLQPDTVSDVEVIEGKFGSGTFTIRYEMNSSNSYKGSAAEEIVRMNQSTMPDVAAKYVQIQERTGHYKVTRTYEAGSGGRYTIVPGTSKMVSSS